MTAPNLLGNLWGAAFVYACASGVISAGGSLLVGLPAPRMRHRRGLLVGGAWLALWVANDIGLLDWWVAFGATMGLILSVYLPGGDDDDGSGGLRQLAGAARRPRDWLAVGDQGARPLAEPGR